MNMQDILPLCQDQLENRITKENINSQEYSERNVGGNGGDCFDWQSINLAAKDNFEIEMVDKKSIFDDKQHGWLWYKNLNIPTLKFKHTSLLRQSRDLNVQIFAVRKGDKSWQDVSLKGTITSCFNSSSSISQLNSLRFSDTSYNYKGQKFILIVAFYETLNVKTNQVDNNNNLKQEDDQEILDESVKSIMKHRGVKLLNLKISPPIYVESRKKSYQERQNKIKFYEPFQPEMIAKHYSKGKGQAIIQNTIEDLHTYFTTATIRHKIYHPFFMLLKFNKAIRLYYNTRVIKINPSDERFFYETQKEIFTNLFDASSESSSSSDDPPLLMCLKKKKNKEWPKDILKIDKFLSNIESTALGYLESSEFPFQIPEEYAEIIYSEQLKSIYTRSYNQISNIQFQMQSQKALANQSAQLLSHSQYPPVVFNPMSNSSQNIGENSASNIANNNASNNNNNSNNTMNANQLNQQNCKQETAHLTTTSSSSPSLLAQNNLNFLNQQKFQQNLGKEDDKYDSLNRKRTLTESLFQNQNFINNINGNTNNFQNNFINSNNILNIPYQNLNSNNNLIYQNIPQINSLQSQSSQENSFFNHQMGMNNLNINNGSIHLLNLNQGIQDSLQQIQSHSNNNSNAIFYDGLDSQKRRDLIQMQNEQITQNKLSEQSSVGQLLSSPNHISQFTISSQCLSTDLPLSPKNKKSSSQIFSKINSQKDNSIQQYPSTSQFPLLNPCSSSESISLNTIPLQQLFQNKNNLIGNSNTYLQQQPVYPNLLQQAYFSNNLSQQNRNGTLGTQIPQASTTSPIQTAEDQIIFLQNQLNNQNQLMQNIKTESIINPQNNNNNNLNNNVQQNQNIIDNLMKLNSQLFSQMNYSDQIYQQQVHNSQLAQQQQLLKQQQSANQQQLLQNNQINLILNRNLSTPEIINQINEITPHKFYSTQLNNIDSIQNSLGNNNNNNKISSQIIPSGCGDQISNTSSTATTKITTTPSNQFYGINKQQIYQTDQKTQINAIKQELPDNINNNNNNFSFGDIQKQIDYSSKQAAGFGLDLQLMSNKIEYDSNNNNISNQPFIQFNLQPQMQSINYLFQKKEEI